MPQTKPKQDGWEDVQAGDGWSDVAAPKPATTLKKESSLASPNHSASRRISQAQPKVTTQQRAASPVSRATDTVNTAIPIAAGAGLTGAGLLAAPLEVAGGLVGAYAGKHGGRFVAKELGGGEEVQDVAGIVGGGVGGLAGGLGAHRMEIPEKVSLPFGIKFRTPSWLNPAAESPEPYQPYGGGSKSRPGYSGVGGAPSYGKPGTTLQPGEFTPPAPPKPVDPVAQAVREGRAAKIPARMPAEEPYKPYKAGPSARLDPYSPNSTIGTPITGRSGVGAAPGLRSRTSTGFVGAAPHPEEGVTLVPESAMGPERYMASVPREELSADAKRGIPGSGTQLQNIGKTILIKPKPTIGRR